MDDETTGVVRHVIYRVRHPSRFEQPLETTVRPVDDLHPPASGTPAANSPGMLAVYCLSLSNKLRVCVCVCVFGLCVSHRNCGRNKRVTSSVLTAWTNSTANQKNKRVLRHDVSWWQVKARLSSPPSIRHGTTAGPHKSQGFTNRTDFFFSGHPNRRCFVCVCVCFSPFVHAVSVVGGL